MVRIAIVEKERCNPIKCQDLCMKLCPINRTGEACIKKIEMKAEIDETLCTGCGICQNRCPFKAISIINLPEELRKEPIHQYGRNGFHLYNLPVPLFGKVVGILGRNGIGKTTALGILAGIIKPNLGRLEGIASSKELIGYFKGTEAQVFFEKMLAGEIRISYKPQQVDLIPKQAKGTVGELLRKVDDKGQLDRVIQELDLKKILDTDISSVSGGELQRIAIAAAVLKKAQVYFFDEPSSYLDIKQRIKVAKFIRSLADSETAVLVIEHDLIILDYMTELLHILYGKPGAFGIVSQPKATKTGINVYLSGYLREENVRFRDKPIRFDTRPPIDKIEKDLLISWEDMTKKMGSFQLKARKGLLRRNEVSGVLGENGIGKTSFVKLLAGVDKPDKGDVNDKAEVSYKPQYLNTESEQLVLEFLEKAIEKFENSIIKPLSLELLFDRKLCELSGGELQKVVIARALSEDVRLFLLDEPSAYLDVEQRLIVSKVIRSVMEERGTTALIVDHDLLLIDYVSDKVMVFDGVPAESGEAKGPFTMEEGMNRFLGDLNITLRRDQESKRPRINKEESQMDRKQKGEGKLYYS